MDCPPRDELLNLLVPHLCSARWRHIASIFDMTVNDTDIIDGLRSRVDCFATLLDNSVRRNDYVTFDLWEKLQKASKNNIIDVLAEKMIKSDQLEG